MAADDVKHKKRKHEAGDGTNERLPKKPKKDKEHKKDKGKGKRSVPAPSEFRTVEGSTVISIPPAWAANPEGCAKEMLDSMLMRYIPALQGVLLSHSNLRFLQDKAAIIGVCPFAVCTIAFRALVWGPTIGMRLKGKVNLCSPDHISLLVHRTFNVSIPRHHIPVDEYTYEWGAAENDPERAGSPEDEIAEAAAAEAAAESGEPRKLGTKDPRWLHTQSRAVVGDDDGYVEFTVVGLKLVNQMLSLVGSIQPDPFSPAHLPAAAAEAQAQIMDVDPPAPESAEKSHKKDKKKKARDADDTEQPKKKRKKKDKEAD